MCLFSLVSAVSALPYASYRADFTIVERKVVANIITTFEKPESGFFYFPLPADVSTIDLYLDDSAAEPVIEEGSLKILLRNTKEVGVKYVSKEFLDKNNFLVNFKAPDTIKSLTVQVTLPEKASLRKPIRQGQITSASIHPMPEQALTDGRSMIFIWERSNLNKDDELSVFVQYKPAGPTVWTVVWIILALLALYFGYNYLKDLKLKNLIPRLKKETKMHKEDPVEKELEFLKHLKEDEQQIIRILKQKEGQCDQGTLRVITDFSKAHLSRLLSELESRKVIHKEKQGKKNLVFLKGK